MMVQRSYAGGGDGGGLVVLAAGNRIVLRAHGETYANNDCDFALYALPAGSSSCWTEICRS